MELDLSIKQSLTLTPQLIQSMEILQMGAQELSEYINETLQENPVLEADDKLAGKEEFSLLSRKLDWLESTDTQNYWYLQQDAQEVDPLVNIAGTDSEDENLYSHLMYQLKIAKLEPAVALAAKYIIRNLDDNGYLLDTLPTISKRLSLDGDKVSEALQLVQSLEPAGIAATSLSECLCLQLERKGEKGLAYKIAKEYLDFVAKNHYNRIAVKLSATVDEVRLACSIIRSLDPRPGAGFSPSEKPEYIIPDLAVVAHPDHLELILNDNFIPALRINAFYKSLLKESNDPQVKEYLSSKLEQARFMVRSIDQRNSTLFACAEKIMNIQEDFFRKGPGHLHPLTLANIADALNVNPSTVSRALRGKYIQCYHGLYPLSSFFSRSLGDNLGEGSSPDEAKSLLKEFISAENKKKPLSDQKLCELLEEKGIQISRRTVAKYRDILGIPPATGRKEI